MPLCRICLTIILLFLLQGEGFAGKLSQELLGVSQRWARLKYAHELDHRLDDLEKLASETSRLVEDQPSNVKRLIWHGIVLSTLAKERGGIDGLTLAKQAKRVLEEAEAIDPSALGGSIYIILGSLYYQVPGYPVGFGNKEKAERYLLKALDISPERLDANFYYGEFLLRNRQFQAAIEVFEKVLALPSREITQVVDEGIKRDAQASLIKAKTGLIEWDIE
jgi:tetratricopeptide (TPR) repeat protein